MLSASIGFLIFALLVVLWWAKTRSKAINLVEVLSLAAMVTTVVIVPLSLDYKEARAELEEANRKLSCQQEELFQAYERGEFRCDDL